MNDTHEQGGKNPLAIAQTILDGFNKHYQLFREFSDEAMACFEHADWARVSEAGKERIQGYEARVTETVENLNAHFPGASEHADWWPDVKASFIALLMNHLQSECAETFYNSVACRVLPSGDPHSVPSICRVRVRLTVVITRPLTVCVAACCK